MRKAIIFTIFTFCAILLAAVVAINRELIASVAEASLGAIFLFFEHLGVCIDYFIEKAQVPQHTITLLTGAILGGAMGWCLRVMGEYEKRENQPDISAPSDSEDVPDYLDPNHPRYTPKLAAAVRAWEAMEDEALLKRKTPKQALEGWIKEHAADYGLVDGRGSLNNTAITECAKTANWNPSGGAPKTFE